MNEENTKKLLEAGPNLFSQLPEELEKLAQGKPFSPIVFCFDCGNGWFQILLDLITKIELCIKDMSPNQKNYFKVLQVKEKYGGLRFYMSSSTEEMESLIEFAHDKSLKTCEKCGNPGKLDTSGYWIYVICEECNT